MNARIRAELEECREWIRTYGIEAENADTDQRYKAGRVDAISFALVMVDNLLEDPRIWEERPNEDAGSA